MASTAANSMQPALIKRTVLASALLLTVSAVNLPIWAEQAPAPGPAHKCPVCGMLVYRYPDFVASVVFADGHAVFFDGAKDLFKYLFDLSTYEPQRSREHITNIRVTEYYDVVPVDARTAFYVVGSDVLGPMGHELIPFHAMADAQLFLKDHHGRRVLVFGQVTPALIERLD